MQEPDNQSAGGGNASLTATIRRKNAAQSSKGRVVVGGRIAPPDPDKPFFERMVTGSKPQSRELRESDPNYARAMLESVAANLQAGRKYLERQEGSLAEMGGKLSEAAALLTASRSPHATPASLKDLQSRFEKNRDDVRDISSRAHDKVALFSVEQSPPVVVAVPAAGEWEGLALDRANLGTPGMVAVDTGKIHGDGPGLILDEGSVRRALADWRKLCQVNRMQWGMLTERLHRINTRRISLDEGEPWSAPPSPEANGQSGLRRPHQFN